MGRFNWDMLIRPKVLEDDGKTEAAAVSDDAITKSIVDYYGYDTRESV